jgi:stage II sporulation protein D
MKSRFLIAIILFFQCLLLHAEPIRVGMFYGANHVRATLLIKAGSYEVFADDISILTLGAEQTADITESSGEIHVFFEGRNYTGYKKLRFITRNQGQFKMTPSGSKPSARVYEENLIAFSYNGHLQLVNEVDIENYVSGVIEAESGKGQELEYYKVQAVISRTYALNNLTRHQSE